MSQTAKEHQGKIVPQHTAFIVDGNRRWAKKQGKNSMLGHKKGAENIEKVFDKARELGSKAVTAWVFSTENWKRSEEEINYLFDMLREYLKKYRKKFLEEKVRFRHLGRKDRLPEDILNQLDSLEKETKDFPEYTVALALDYGGHDELVRAFEKLQEQGLEITEENIEKCLDTAEMPTVDLIIRTGGAKRLSGFMSWQNHYAEFAFPEVGFPGFTTKMLEKIYEDFANRDRRFGGNSNDETRYLSAA